MAFKVDLKKTYDRIRLEYVDDTILDVGFPPNLIKVIMHCISSYSMQLLWNGYLTHEF